MRKHYFGIILLTLSLLLGTPTYTAYAEEITADTGEEITYLETIHISTAEELIDLADSCRLDTWSLDRLVVLEADIDLTDIDFSSIPTFGGTFEGNGYTIRGLSITEEGNTQGLFRYLQSTAIVQNLSVEGEIHPAGTSSTPS